MTGVSHNGQARTVPRPDLPPLPPSLQSLQGAEETAATPVANASVATLPAPPESVTSGTVEVQSFRPELPPLPPELKPLASQLVSPTAVVAKERHQDRTETMPAQPASANDTSGAAFAKNSSPKPAAAPASSSSNIKPVLVAAMALAVIAAVVFFVGQVTGGTAIVSQLDSGECVEDFFQTAEDGTFVEIFSVGTVDCAQPHAYEVFTTSATLFPDDAFPGIQEAFATGQEFCLTEYETFIGGDQQNLATWDVWTFVPPESAWEGDRVVQCLVGDRDQMTLFEGTLRGAAAQ